MYNFNFLASSFFFQIMVLAKADVLFRQTNFIYGTGLGLQLIEVCVISEYFMRISLVYYYADIYRFPNE